MQVVTTAEGIGLLSDGVVSVLDTSYRHVGDVIAETGSLICLAGCGVRTQVPLTACAVLPPLGTPRAIWGVGLNYRSKAATTGRPLPDQPILYLSASSAASPDGGVAIPVEQTLEMDYEGEIALVVGRRLYQADPAQVWASIAGITAANDMSARDVMRDTGSPTLAKSFPGFSPIGMSVVTPDEFADLGRIALRTWVNGELLQDDTSAGMIFSVPDLVARLSRYAALEPGDVVLTGTPAGTGQDRARYLGAGDVVRVEVENVLPLVTTVATPTAPFADPPPVQLADQAR